MRTGAHTQGEWEARIYGGWDTPRIWSPSGSIALLQHHESGPAEGEANARLIASAPDLLDALKTAQWMLERDRIDDQKMAVIDKCRAAIAKATGSAT